MQVGFVFGAGERKGVSGRGRGWEVAKCSQRPFVHVSNARPTSIRTEPAITGAATHRPVDRAVAEKSQLLHLDLSDSAKHTSAKIRIFREHIWLVGLSSDDVGVGEEDFKTGRAVLFLSQQTWISQSCIVDRRNFYSPGTTE